MNSLKALNKSRCERCREKMKKEAEHQIVENTLEAEYKYFQSFQENALESIRDIDFTLFFAALVSEGCDKEYVNKIFDKVVMYSSVSELFGKKLTADATREILREEYGLDFNRIEYHCETLDDFKKRYFEENPDQ
jgi:hypothetical protein